MVIPCFGVFYFSFQTAVFSRFYRILSCIKFINKFKPGIVAYCYNPSYLGDWEDHGLKSAGAKSMPPLNKQAGCGGIHL
jgi:hypothetical protein